MIRKHRETKLFGILLDKNPQGAIIQLEVDGDDVVDAIYEFINKRVMITITEISNYIQAEDA